MYICKKRSYMFRQEEIAAVIDLQKEQFMQQANELKRDSLPQVPILSSFTTIVTGIRRCGKSTLLLQVLKSKYKDALYFNFDDIRMAGFETADFKRLLSEIYRRKTKVLFFDEPQIIPQWEIFIHQLLREKYTVFVTGSNASLLSKELGTHLTGRHIDMELFPFSYNEFLKYKKRKANAKSLQDYMRLGGIPEYLKTERSEYLINLANDIIVRDIVVRHNIKDADALKQLAVYLFSNVGNLVSANKLTGMYGIKTAATFLEYFNYFKDCYLFEFLPQFGYSLKAQARNPKKIYAMDTGLINEISGAFTENTGHLLENLVYLHLRRTNKNLFFYKGKGECDFITIEKNKAKSAIQVCHQIDDYNFEREYRSLLEAMQFFKLKEGVIVTSNQSDTFTENGVTIRLIPAYDFLNT